MCHTTPFTSLIPVNQGQEAGIRFRIMGVTSPNYIPLTITPLQTQSHKYHSFIHSHYPRVQALPAASHYIL